MMSRKAPQIAGCCLLTYTFLENVCSIRMSNGPSMQPTIRPNGDLLVVNRIPNWRKDYKTGDVVLSVSKDNENKTVCKRIGGTAGDKILHIDYNTGKLRNHIVGDGQVWLIGDNPENSHDSTAYGDVPLGLLRGTVIYKIQLVPPRICTISNTRSAPEDGVVSRKALEAQSYNLSRANIMPATLQEWEFLLEILQSDERCKEMTPPERRSLRERAQKEVEKAKRLRKVQKAGGGGDDKASSSRDS